MKILVTGGAGYIGSVTVEQLVHTGAEVVVFDNLSLGHRAAVHPDATLVVGDLADRAAIDDVLATTKPDAVMHFAARSQVGESMREPFRYIGDNVTCGLNLIESMVEHGIGRFILSSTAALFGEPQTIPIDENERIVPGSPYGESKHMLERILAWTDKVHGMRYAALRYFNAAGASEQRGEHHDPETHLIPLVLQVAQGKREAITVFGDDYPTRDGTCIRDYIHIIDLAQAHILALGALDEGSRVYNLGNGEGFSVMEVIETARTVTGHPIPHTMGERRPGDPAALTADSRKIRAELQWTPRFPKLHDIVDSAWRWHQAFPSGYPE
ncbi:MAG: UDP-glucose 4-epimerase GalE [Deltaproteobacteria bacterium]|nr:UDP-glucose 4-epimerase GalE [Deltaproteobacteria bacterium]